MQRPNGSYTRQEEVGILIFAVKAQMFQNTLDFIGHSST